MDAENDILWVGDDTDGDLAIDFAHADIGTNGVYEYSAYLLPNGEWQQTNLVEAWLEMGFSLPWNRDSYHPHDVSIVLNDTVIGELKDTLPEGNYSFRIPPRAIHFDTTGRPSDNVIKIKSEHLRGGHYVVNSDFRFRLRLTETGVWAAGKDRAEAFANATKTEGLSLTGSDFSLSSSQMRTSPEDQLESGDEVLVEIPVRNLGAMAPEHLDVVLFEELNGNPRKEVSRVAVTPVPITSPTLVSIPWRAKPGNCKLTVSIDPDGVSGDTDLRNNEATLHFSVPGFDAGPSIRFLDLPQETAASRACIVPVWLAAADDLNIQRVEVSVDGSLWQQVASDPGTHKVMLLLQPGQHTVQARAVDSSGQMATVEKKMNVPEVADSNLEIVYPTPGKQIASRVTNVIFNVPSSTLFAAVRASNGPWYPAKRIANTANAKVPLRFGLQELEAMIVSRGGLVQHRLLQIDCLEQPKPGQFDEKPDASDPGWVLHHGFGYFNYFRSWNGVLLEHNPLDKQNGNHRGN